MNRTVLDEGTAMTPDGYTVTVKGLSEDLDAGEASVANRGAVGLRVEGPDGLVGRSVVIHEDEESSLDTVPGARNNRMACGVIGPMQGISF